MQRNLRMTAAVEITAMAALILSYIWGWQGTFTGAAALVALGYFGIGYLGHRARGETLHYVGLRIDNWRPAIRNAVIVSAVAGSATILVGAALDSWRFPSWTDAAATLPLLIIWGTVQQYGLLCVFYRRLGELIGNTAFAMVGAAAFFAIFHLPNSFLTVVTLVAGVGACALYRLVPNVLAIGVAHALISFTLTYSLPLGVTAGLRVGPGYFKFVELEQQQAQAIACAPSTSSCHRQ